MTNAGYSFAVLFAAAVLTLGLGCKAKTEVASAGPTAADQAALQLPEGTNVLAALAQKDYEGAVSALAKLQQTVGEGGPLAGPYLTLKLHVKNQLIELAPTDPKAAEALSALRLLTQGR